MKRQYAAILRKEGRGMWSVVFPDFGYAVGGSGTPEKLIKEAGENLEKHVRRLIDTLKPVPFQSSKKLTKKYKGLSDKLVLVEIEVPEGERTRVNVTMEKRVLEKIDAFRRKRGMTRSAFLSDAALWFVQDRQRETI